MEETIDSGLVTYSEGDVIYAYLIHSTFTSSGVNFITGNQAEFQIGIMERDGESLSNLTDIIWLVAQYIQQVSFCTFEVEAQ